MNGHPKNFWSRVSKTKRCWWWLGTISNGYGYLYYKGKTNRAHTVSLLLLGFKIPKKMHVDHICRNRSCVRPSHLRIVTARENTLAPGSLAIAAINHKKTHCKHGHKLSKNNLVPNRIKRLGHRECLACARKADRIRRPRKDRSQTK